MAIHPPHICHVGTTTHVSRKEGGGEETILQARRHLKPCLWVFLGEVVETDNMVLATLLSVLCVVFGVPLITGQVFGSLEWSFVLYM